MPISSSLSARLGPGTRAHGRPRTVGPLRPPLGTPQERQRHGLQPISPPRTREGEAPRPRARAESRGGSSRGAAAPAPTQWRLGDPKKSDQKTDPEPAGTSPEPILEPRVEESRGCSGFVFLCSLAGHKEAITGISMPMGSNKLYSASADGSVRVWHGKSGEEWWW
ncbi:Zinc finger CCCH domain-containing protein 17 [Hordeum vulgare]|nr:Zinc finger CCCH domain-containing protein 17 [Hordeum vulgare]